MPTIDLLGNAYAFKLNSRRRLEAEARVWVKKQLESIESEFDQMVLRSKNEGAKITHIARAMQTSTTVVYECIKRAERLIRRDPSPYPTLGGAIT